MSQRTESWSCDFEGCGRVYYSERGIRRHYILLHRHRYWRGRAPLYIHDDREYERLKLRLRRGQRHRQPRTGSDDGDRRDDGTRPPAAAVPHAESMVRSPRVSDRSQHVSDRPKHVSGRSQRSSAAVSSKGDSHGPVGHKGRHPGSYGPHSGSSGPSEQSDSRHGSSAGPSGQSGRSGKQRGQFSGSSGQSGPSSSVAGSSSKVSGSSGPSGRFKGDSRSSRSVPSGKSEPGRQGCREGVSSAAGSAAGPQPYVEQYSQFAGSTEQFIAPQGEFIIPQYSADGHLIGWHTSHNEQGQVSGQQSSVPVGEEDVPLHRAKVPRTEPSDAASAGGRPMASTSRRQSSFTETRGKRQQFDTECISSDDDDTVNVGTGAAFHVWYRPTEPARSPAPSTVPVAEAVFGVQEGGPTVTHITLLQVTSLTPRWDSRRFVIRFWRVARLTCRLGTSLRV